MSTPTSPTQVPNPDLSTSAASASSSTPAAAAARADPLASALKSLLDPTMAQTADKLALVQRSQLALSAELDRLLTSLQEYLDTNPPEVKETVVKLAATGKRLAAVNVSLNAIQLRVNRIYIQLSKQRIPLSPTPS